MQRLFDAAYFAARVKRRRGSASLRAAAAALGTSASTLDRIEREAQVPDVEFFLQLCGWIDASPQEFFLSQTGAEPSAVHMVEQALRREGRLDPELIEALTRFLDLLDKRHAG